MAGIAAFEGGTSNVASVAESMGQRSDFGTGGDGMESDMQQVEGALGMGRPAAAGAGRGAVGANRLGSRSPGTIGSRVFANEARRTSAPGGKSVI